MALVKLLSAGSHSEAQLVKGLLESEGIACIVNAESRMTDMGPEAGFAEILLLVEEDQLKEAQEVLAAQPVDEKPGGAGEPSEGGVCPVHEQPATGVCSRCGSHLCAACGAVGTPPTCESCEARLSQDARPRTKTKVAAWLVLVAIFGPALLLMLIELVSNWLH